MIMKTALLSTLFAVVSAKKPAQGLRALSEAEEQEMSMPSLIETANVAQNFFPLSPTGHCWLPWNCHITNAAPLTSRVGGGDWRVQGETSDTCAEGTSGWNFDICLNLSFKGHDVVEEQTQGTITLIPPASCTNVPDIVCKITKFRTAPSSGYSGHWTGPMITAAGHATYDDGTGSKTHSCAVLYGQSASITAAIQFVLLPVGVSPQSEWIYTTTYPASGDRWREFESELALSTDWDRVSPNAVAELEQCGLHDPL